METRPHTIDLSPISDIDPTDFMKFCSDNGFTINIYPTYPVFEEIIYVTEEDVPLFLKKIQSLYER